MALRPVTLLLSSLALAGCGSSGGGDAPPAPTRWQMARAAARPVLALPAEFGTPRIQPIAVDGWEDGICISRDGLHLYAVYCPADLLSFLLVGGNDMVHAAEYRRGPTLGMDLATNPLGFTTWLHGDIIHASRTNVAQPFSAWRLAPMAKPFTSEGAPQPSGDLGATWDLFACTSNDHDPDYKAHIAIIRGQAKDPATAAALLPAPVTANTAEDNPHVERLDATHLVLFFDSDDRQGPGHGHDIWFTTSADDGAAWAAPAPLTLNTDAEEEQPHLYQDSGGAWWMYFTATDGDGKLSIYRTAQQTAGNWDSWGPRELVIGAGNTAGVGEPTLTAAGDLSFVVVLDDAAHGTNKDRYDADPWIAPHVPSGIGKR